MTAALGKALGGSAGPATCKVPMARAGAPRRREGHRDGTAVTRMADVSQGSRRGRGRGLPEAGDVMADEATQTLSRRECSCRGSRQWQGSLDTTLGSALVAAGWLDRRLPHLSIEPPETEITPEPKPPVPVQ
jgi:hypothetical protein